MLLLEQASRQEVRQHLQVFASDLDVSQIPAVIASLLDAEQNEGGAFGGDRSCSWRLVVGLGLEKGKALDGGRRTQILRTELYGIGGAGAFGEARKRP